MSYPAHPSGGASVSLGVRTAIGLAALALLAVVLSAAACGDGDDETTPTPTATPSRTPGPPPETLLEEEINGVPVKLEYQPASGTYVVAISGLTVERYRKAKAALEERLASLVPDPCRVRWTTSILLADELAPEDLETSGC